MALISCPECGHQVSDQAAICPSCGIKIAGNPAINSYRHIVFDSNSNSNNNSNIVNEDKNDVDVTVTATPSIDEKENDTAAKPMQQQLQWSIGEQNEGTKSEISESNVNDENAYDDNKADDKRKYDDDNLTIPPYRGTSSQYDEPKKNKGLIMMLSFIIALVVCIVAYWLWSNATGEKREQQRYEEAMLSTNVQDLKDYLVEFNDAPQEHRDSVNARLTVLTQEDADWSNALASGSKSKLADFIKTHPQSLHKGEAEDLIDSIDFSTADRKGTPEAYAEYLKIHPDSRRAAMAQEYLDNKKAKEVTAQEKTTTRDICKRFFQAINAHNDEKLCSTVTSDAEQNAISFMNKLYKSDITNMNWHILDPFKVSKGVEGSSDPANLVATFDAEQNIERTEASLETYAKYAVTIEVTPEGKITKFNVKKK